MNTLGRILSLSLLFGILSACGGGGGDDATTDDGTTTGDGITTGDSTTSDPAPTVTAAGWATQKIGYSGPIRAITWNGSQYLAVGGNGKAITSSDGINWSVKAEQLTFPAGFDVIWADNMYVSVGSSNSIKTSPDGLDWTSRHSCSCLDDLFKVAWNGSLYVAAGEAGRVYSSPDAMSWTEQTSGVESFIDIYGLAASNIRFVIASGDATAGMRYSDDGVSWTPVSYNPVPASIPSIQTINWDGSQFIASGFGTTYISADGITWSPAAYDNLLEIFPANGNYFAFNTFSGLNMSSDLANWTNVVTYANQDFRDFVYNPDLGQYVSVGGLDWYTRGWISTSSNGVDWTMRVGSADFVSVIWDGTQFMALDYSGLIFRSSDGLDWVSTAAVPTGGILSVYSDLIWESSLSRYVALKGDAIYSSEDGETWTERYNDTFLSSQSIIWTGTQFMVAGFNGNMIVSSDGISWSKNPINLNTTHFYDVAWAEPLGLYVAISGYDVLTSNDGVTWTEQLDVTTSLLQSIIWTGSRFVIVGNSGTIISSTDGFSWDDSSIAYGPFLKDVIQYGSVLLAVGTNGDALVSGDQLTWTELATDTTLDIHALVATPTKALAVGERGIILSY